MKAIKIQLLKIIHNSRCYPVTFGQIVRKIPGFSGSETLSAGHENIILCRCLSPMAIRLLGEMEADEGIGYYPIDVETYILEKNSGYPADLPIWKKSVGLQPGRPHWLPVCVVSGRMSSEVFNSLIEF